MSELPAATEECDYCGLPLAPARSRASTPLSASSRRPEQYCCFGCRFAAAIAKERATTGHSHWMMARLALSAFLSMNVMMFSMVLWTHDVYATGVDIIGSSAATMPMLDELLRWLCLVLSLPVLLLLGGPMLESSVAALAERRFSTDVLLILGVGAAFGYSIVSVLRSTGHVYFEVGCVILITVTLGRWLEATGKQKTTDALASLERLLPREVRVVRHGAEIALQIAEIVAGDVLRVLAGERFAADGVLQHGRATVDEQLVTGECAPVEKQPGDLVHGGTLNLDGDLLLVATSSSDGGMLARIIDAVRRAATRKDRYQRLADRVAAWFTPLVVVAAVATGIIHTQLSGFEVGLMASLAVVLIACPCALGLATPMAVWAALGRAARHQVLFRDGDALARLAGVRAVMFDKTGTLSSDALSVASVVVTSGESPERVIAAAAALSAGSTHPLSRAVSQFATLTLRETWFRRAESVSTVAGRGLNAELAELSTTAYLGSVRYMEELDLAIDAVLQQRLDAARCEGRSVVCVGWRGRVRGYFLLEESLRPRAAETIAWLGAHGIRTGILSGDHESRCQRLCEQIGHAGVAIHAELLPDEKLALIHRTRHEVGTVAMVGDGINDAPALAAADIGIALGCGADVSRESADVCLLSNDLSRLPWAIWLAQRTVRAIRWNLFWALSYNIAGVALAAAGFLNPIVAAIAMTASSLLVISNSLRLGREAENAFGESATAIAIANQPRTDDSAEKLARTTSRD